MSDYIQAKNKKALVKKLQKLKRLYKYLMELKPRPKEKLTVKIAVLFILRILGVLFLSIVLYLNTMYDNVQVQQFINTMILGITNQNTWLIAQSAVVILGIFLIIFILQYIVTSYFVQTKRYIYRVIDMVSNSIDSFSYTSWSKLLYRGFVY